MTKYRKHMLLWLFGDHKPFLPDLRRAGNSFQTPSCKLLAWSGWQLSHFPAGRREELHVHDALELLNRVVKSGMFQLVLQPPLHRSDDVTAKPLVRVGQGANEHGHGRSPPHAVDRVDHAIGTYRVLGDAVVHDDFGKERELNLQGVLNQRLRISQALRKHMATDRIIYVARRCSDVGSVM